MYSTCCEKLRGNWVTITIKTDLRTVHTSNLNILVRTHVDWEIKTEQDKLKINALSRGNTIYYNHNKSTQIVYFTHQQA